MAESPLRITRNGGVLEVVLDRPPANAIDATTSRAMGDCFAAFRDDPELRWGLLKEIVPSGELMPRARALAELLALGPPLVFAAIKEVARESATLPEQEALARVAARRYPTVDRLYSSEDQLEGARAFVEK